MMTRKHFEAIAAVLRQENTRLAQGNVPDYAGQRTLSNLTDRLADAFADENPRFDRQRFIAACQGE